MGFKWYHEIRKAFSTWITRRSQHRQAKQPTTQNPQAGLVLKESSQLGKAKLNFFQTDITFFSAPPCSVALAAASQSFTVHIECCLGYFSNKAFLRSQRSYFHLQIRAIEVAGGALLM